MWDDRAIIYELFKSLSFLFFFLKKKKKKKENFGFEHQTKIEY